MVENDEVSETEGLILKTVLDLEEFFKFISPEEKHSWFRQLHTCYMDKFLQDNNRTWTIASIFTPLSLAGLISSMSSQLKVH